MDTDFWLRKWQTNELGFHQPQANALMVRHFNQLGLCHGSRVFLPLCGKTNDISWLLSGGFRIAGAELSELAIEQLFDNLEITPAITKMGDLVCYRANQIDIFVGDFFNLSQNTLGPVEAVYDRAALVALPEDVRRHYSNHLMDISGHVSQLLITFEYDQNQMPGPPFSISSSEVMRHYKEHYAVTRLAAVNVAGGLKGKCKASEMIWLLQN